MPITVLVENTYTCGRESEFVVELPQPSAHDEDAVEQWWEECAFDATGDAHLTADGQPCAEREDALYEVTVLTAPSFPELVGEKREWGL